MNSIALRTMLVQGIKAAIKNGDLPEYEFKVSVTSGTTMQTVTVYTWLADIDSISSVLEKIFKECVGERDVLFNILHPPTKHNPAFSYDENLRIWEEHVKVKMDEFYTANPKWRMSNA